MNKNGFTLIEMLVVLFILSILITMGYRAIVPKFEDSKEDTLESQIEMIKASTKMYVNDHLDVIEFDSNNQYIININTLGNEGYMELPIKNPVTNEEIDPNTKIIITKNKLEYIVVVDLP